MKLCFRPERAIARYLLVVGALQLLLPGCYYEFDGDHDPFRCHPKCDGGKLCYRGRCIAADGGPDLSLPDVWQPNLDWQGAPSDAVPADHSGADSDAGVLTAPFLLYFETDNGNLVGTRDWEWGHLAFNAGVNCDGTAYQPPPAGHSGTGVWGTKLNDCYSPLGNAKDPCTNADTTDDSVLTLLIQLPPGLLTPRLTFWEWADCFLPYDWTEVRIDNKVVSQDCSGTSSATPTWQKRTIDLKAYVGQTIVVQFHFMASEVVNYAGWYLDDISVSES